MNTEASSPAPAFINPALRGAPYRDENAYLEDCFALLALHLSAALTIRQAAERDGAATAVPPGMALPLDASLGQATRHPWKPAPEKALFADEWEYLYGRTAAALEAGIFPRLEWLRCRFRLDEFSFFALLCAYAVSRDRSFETLFVAIHMESTLRFATLGAVQALYGLAQGDGIAEMQLLSAADSPAARLLFRPADATIPEPLRPLELQPQIACFLNGQSYRDPHLLPWHRSLPGAGTPPGLLRRDRQLKHAQAAVGQMAKDGRTLLILAGPEGSGRKLTLGTLANGGENRFLLARPEEVLRHGDSVYALAACLAACLAAIYLLEGRIPALELFEEPEDSLSRLLALLARDKVPVILITPPLRRSVKLEPYLVHQVDYPSPGLEESLYFWEVFAKSSPRFRRLPVQQLAAKHILAPGRIAMALKSAAARAEAQGLPPDADAVDAAVLQGNTNRLSEVADRIEPLYDWDDLVLSAAAKERLRFVCDRIRLRSVVEGQWGFGKKDSYGKGISVLLYGPPGTGKTMCALVVARQLNLPIYRINLAQIISKYIGEAAQNLDTVFSQAKNSNVILFFDEADALFSKRTDIKSSNDRYANSESAYLLQKIEEYNGISILATNLSSNFDDAFRRRISYMINIHMPSAEQRLEIWQRSIPPGAPVSGDADLRQLAETLEFSGSVIRSAATQAAYFAAGRGGAIAMRDLVQAARMELQKLGKSEPHFMAAYPAAENAKEP